MAIVKRLSSDLAKVRVRVRFPLVTPCAGGVIWQPRRSQVPVPSGVRVRPPPGAQGSYIRGCDKPLLCAAVRVRATSPHGRQTRQGRALVASELAGNTVAFESSAFLASVGFPAGRTPRRQYWRQGATCLTTGRWKISQAGA